MTRLVYFYPHMIKRAGTERILSDKMNYLAENGNYNITLITFEQSGLPLSFPLSPKIRHLDLGIHYYRYYHINLFKRIFIWHKLDQELQEKYNNIIFGFKPDIVITTTMYSKLLKIVTHCPFKSIRILESHIDRKFLFNQDSVYRNRLSRTIFPAIKKWQLSHHASKFNLLISLNKDDARDWSKYLDVKIIYNMVHLNPTKEMSDHSSKSVIFAGRYNYQKGIPDLIKIWTLVHHRHPDWQLHLYGEGEMRTLIEHMAVQSQSNIHIHDSKPNIFDYYVNSSIFVLTSIYEPFGLVMPEAMSCGLPVVAFDCPSGPSTIVTNNLDGFLIKERNIYAFAEKVCYLIEHPEQRIKMGKNAAISSKKYSAEQIMPQWINLFNGLVKKI